VKGNVTAGHDGVSGGVSGTIAKDGVTAQGGVTASTSTGINANASVDVKGQKGSVDYEPGADAQAGTSGISADAFSVTPDLLAQRLAASPLTAEQKQVLLAAYHELSNGTKHIKVPHESGVPAMYALLHSGTKDPQAFANLLDSHPNDMQPMLQEIVQTPGYGLEFANQVARAAGIMDKVVVTPDGTVRIAPPGVAA
jgi:hypothetical protein